MASDPSIRNTGSGAIASRGGVAAGAKGVAIGGNVEGDVDVHYHAPPATPTLHATPPAPPAHFTGHEDDLTRLTQLLTSSQHTALTALRGMGGIGKTSLALKLAERLHPHFPGGVLWWSLGPHPDPITALDVWARHADPSANLSALPTAQARAEVVRPMLAKLDKLCVFIDDVWDAESFNILKSAVPPGCPVLLTTRDGDLAKSLRCRVENIDALKDGEAIEVLAKLLGPLNGREHAALAIVHLTGGLPLALELIAGIADSPSDLPTIAGQLRTQPILDVLQRGETREQSIEVCFTMSYQRLDADSRRRFRALGVFAPAPFDRDAIAAVWGDENGAAADNAIRLLQRRSLLTRAVPSETDAAQNDAGTRNPGNVSEIAEYKQHALLREYAVKLLNVPPLSSIDVVSDGEEVDYESFGSRHAAYYLRFAQEQNWRAVERAFEQIEWGWRWVRAHASGRILDYVYAAETFLRTRGRNLELVDWLDVALTQTRSAQDRKGEGVIRNDLGLVYNALGQKDKALDFYQQALAIHREVGNRTEEGTTLNNLGGVYDTLGQNDKVLDFLQQALAIHREVGNRTMEGTTLNNLGLVYDALGQKDNALDFYQQALAIQREVGNRTMEGTTLNNLGIVYDALGQQDKALDFYQQALAIHRKVGNRYGEGIALWNMGILFERMDCLEEAESALKEAVGALRDCGSPQADPTQEWLERVRVKRKT